jgi:hypothetical protein
VTGAGKGAALAAAVAGALAVAWLSRAPLRLRASDDALLRLAFSARPERVERCTTRTDEELAAVPAHMRQRVACEGAAARYRLVVRRDGVTLADEVVTGAGARHDRPLYVLRDFPTHPGAHRVEVTFERMDSTVADARRRGEAVPPRLAFEGTHALAPRTALLITYDVERRALVARAPEAE